MNLKKSKFKRSETKRRAREVTFSKSITTTKVDATRMTKTTTKRATNFLNRKDQEELILQIDRHQIMRAKRSLLKEVLIHLA